MKTLKRIFGISLLLVALLVSNQVEAQRKDNKRDRGVQTERAYGKNNRVATNHNGGNRYRTQPIRRNPHYRYPKHRKVVRTLHHKHLRFVYGGLPYFYYAGIYYSVYGDEYIVVIPPRGFRVGVLPVGYVRIMVGPSVYFYHSGVYYNEVISSNSDEKYEITQPPVGAVITDISNEAEQVVMDGNVLYEYNDTFYKQIKTDNGKTAYEVVFSKNNNN